MRTVSILFIQLKESDNASADIPLPGLIDLHPVEGTTDGGNGRIARCR